MSIVRSYLFPLFAFTVGLLLILAISSFNGSLEDQRSIVDPCPGEAGETSTCWDEYFAQVIKKDGPIAALGELKTQYEKGGGGRLFCHPILHKIGAAAGENFGTIAEAFRYGDPVCRSGYYHGVMEYLFGEEGDAGNERLLSGLDTLCAEARGKERYSYDYFACVHGIGHGIMAYFDVELFQSLAACETLTGSWEQETCAGGVFHANLAADTPETPSKYLKEDDLAYPCNAVKERYRNECFQMQSSYMLAQNGGDFSAAFASCRNVDAEYRDSCYQSIGRDASGWSYGKESVVLNYCSLGTTLEERTACLIGAASDFIQSVGRDEARALCAAGEEGARVSCSQAVEWQLGAL